MVKWLALQGRFKHLLKDDPDGLIAWHQERVEQEWASLLARESQTAGQTNPYPGRARALNRAPPEDMLHRVEPPWPKTRRTGESQHR